MHIHQHIAERIKNTELNEIFWSMSLRTFAVSIITIFIPIYFFKLGYSFFEIFLFLTFLNLFTILTDSLAAKVVTIIGPKHTIVLSFPALMVFLWFLLTLPVYHWNLYFLATIFALETGLFWMGYHVDLSKAKDSENCTSEISKIDILASIFGALAPFIGGFIATNYGIGFTLILAMVFLVFASFPLFRTSEPHIRQTIDMSKISLKKIWRDLISYGGLGIDMSATIFVWPIFVFLLFKSYESVGIIESLALFITITATFIAGKYADHTNKPRLIKRGGAFNGIIWLIKTIIQNGAHVLLVNFANAITFPFLKLPFASEFYIHADEEARIEYILWMERMVDLSRGLYFLVLAILAFYFDIKIVLIFGFILAAMGAFLAGMMRPAETDLKNSCK